MPFIRLFPCAAAACLALVVSFAAAAQTPESHVKLVSKIYPSPAIATLKRDPVIIPSASPESVRPRTTIETLGHDLQFQQLMSASISQRLGSPYSWGATGPGAFDCSGFVWATFQAAGINFDRGSARNLWSRFSAPAPGEQYKFGTLVFFSNLAHVGIVADENGFYHASRHHGVIYSPFNDYWVSRIDGFRKVPMPETDNSKLKITN